MFKVCDLFTGLSFYVPEKWTVRRDLKTGAISVHDPVMPLKAVSFRIFKAKPVDAAKLYLNRCKRALMEAARQGTLAVSGPFDVKTSKYGEGGLVLDLRIPVTGMLLSLAGLPQNEVLVNRAYVIPLKNGLTLVSDWLTLSSLASVYPSVQQLDQIARSVSICKPIPASRASVPDVMRGMNAYHVLLPRDATLSGQVYPDGSLVCSVKGANYVIQFQPSPQYVDPGPMGMNPFFAQSFAMQGARIMRCMSARDYACQVLNSMGAQLEEFRDVGPIPVTTNSIIEALAMARGGMGQGFYDSILAKFRTSSGEGWLWVTVYGLRVVMPIPFTVWRAATAYIMGPPGYSDYMMSLFLTVMSGLMRDPKWAQVLRKEATRRMKALHRSIMRDIRARRQLQRQIQETFRETDRMIMDSFYSDLRTSMEETQRLSDTLGSTWDTTTSSSTDLSDYDIGGTGTQRFYLDYEGRLRAYGTEEELPVAEIGSDGTLYDDEGREIGRIDEGYIYDSEGDRVGFIDTEISDNWQLELLEQQLPDADRTLGRDIFGPEEEEADYPAYVTRTRREAEEEEE